MLRPFLSPHRSAAAPASTAAAAAAAAAAGMRPASSSSRSSAGGGGASHHHGHHGGGHNVSASPETWSTCTHTPSSATLDLLILLLVLFSLSFLLASSLAHVARSLSPLLATPHVAAALAHAASVAAAALPYLAATAVLAAAAFFACRRLPHRRCRNPRCRGLRKALEFDVQLQTEEAVRAGAGSTVGGADAAMWREIEALPWKGGQGGNNPDYECLRAELRRMAPPNGRAVLLFRNRCGCPVAKLEGWGVPKSKRRNKKGTQGPFHDRGVR